MAMARADIPILKMRLTSHNALTRTEIGEGENEALKISRLIGPTVELTVPTLSEKLANC